MMDREHWKRIEAVLGRAFELDAGAREAFVRDACGSDDELRAEVESLLRYDGSGGFLSARPVLPILRPELAGRTIGHYRIVGRIGAGGMGEVWEARDEHLPRPVAIKVLPAELTADPARARRFEQEAIAASKLNHPNIVTIHEVVRDGGAHYIVAERIEGVTLRELLARGPVSVAQALEIAIQIAAALEAAHAAGIVHRDIKPENVMLRADGVVKVLDFGIAKLGAEAADEASSAVRDAPAHNLTIPGSVLGTVRYMSPEQARGETLDPRTDLYSLGVVLREMLAGTPPKELQRTLRRMLEPERDDRHESATALLHELRGVKQRLDSRRWRRIVWSVAAGAVVLTVIAALLSINETWDERILRDGHSAAARQVVFSPDGRLLLSGGEDGRAIVWDFASRQRLATLDHAAMKVAWAPDGRWFATGARDGSIVIWDARTRTASRVLRGHQTEIGSLEFSPDSTLLASSSYDRPHGRTILWDAATWSRRHEWAHGGFGTFLFAPALQQFLTSADLFVYDAVSGRRIRERHPDIGANWVALSPDRSEIAGVDGIGTLSFYRLHVRGDLRRLDLVWRNRPHQDHGRSVVYSPDGSLLATAAEDIILWDPRTRRKLARFEYSAVVWSVAFSPDGRWLVSSHADGAVLIWDVDERARVASLNEHSAAVRAVAFAPDGRTVASGGEDRTVTLWDAASGRKRAVLGTHATRVTAVSFSRNGAFASGDQDGRVVIWDVAKKQPRVTIGPGLGPLIRMELSPDGRYFAMSRGLFDTTGRMLVDFSRLGRVMWVYGVSFSADGKRLACVTDGGYLLLWDVENRRLLEAVHVRGTSQIAVSISPDGTRIATGEDEGAIRLWSLAPLRQIAILGRHTARVKSVAFAPDGETVASAGDDKMIALWNVDRRRLRARIGTHASPIYAIAFSHDGRRLVSGEHDRSVRVYTRHRSVWRLPLE